MVFGGGITPDLTAPWFTHLTLPLKIFTAPTYSEASQNYRKMYLKLILSWHFNAHVRALRTRKKLPPQVKKKSSACPYQRTWRCRTMLKGRPIGHIMLVRIDTPASKNEQIGWITVASNTIPKYQEFTRCFFSYRFPIFS